MSKPSPVDVFNAIFDGYSATELASGFSTAKSLAANTDAIQKAFDATRTHNPTPEQQKDAHEALALLLDGDDEDDLVNGHGINPSDAEAFMDVINSGYEI
ncbi:hypothetical protein [Vibrio crassostreae]|uniref:hypothetical protein n=1 Tax=Vibrio crassostreae TaxID=246167 RepID=UPI001B315BCE|nr:hypothetical protein [Vibrio crassostreae]